MGIPGPQQAERAVSMAFTHFFANLTPGREPGGKIYKQSMTAEELKAVQDFPQFVKIKDNHQSSRMIHNYGGFPR